MFVLALTALLAAPICEVKIVVHKRLAHLAVHQEGVEERLQMKKKRTKAVSHRVIMLHVQDHDLNIKF